MSAAVDFRALFGHAAAARCCCPTDLPRGWRGVSAGCRVHGLRSGDTPATDTRDDRANTRRSTNHNNPKRRRGND